ncbi:hypothetical protein Pelo_11257 [Pelomyxa schiedti]|nr:hypothetical protein Pelo_11257 [Pelomyxa schiedti]
MSQENVVDRVIGILQAQSEKFSSQLQQMHELLQYHVTLAGEGVFQKQGGIAGLTSGLWYTSLQGILEPGSEICSPPPCVNQIADPNDIITFQLPQPQQPQQPSAAATGMDISTIKAQLLSAGPQEKRGAIALLEKAPTADLVQCAHPEILSAILNWIHPTGAEPLETSLLVALLKVFERLNLSVDVLQKCPLEQEVNLLHNHSNPQVKLLSKALTLKIQRIHHPDLKTTAKPKKVNGPPKTGGAVRKRTTQPGEVEPPPNKKANVNTIVKPKVATIKAAAKVVPSMPKLRASVSPAAAAVQPIHPPAPIKHIDTKKLNNKQKVKKPEEKPEIKKNDVEKKAGIAKAHDEFDALLTADDTSPVAARLSKVYAQPKCKLISTTEERKAPKKTSFYEAQPLSADDIRKAKQRALYSGQSATPSNTTTPTSTLAASLAASQEKDVKRTFAGPQPPQVSQTVESPKPLEKSPDSTPERDDDEAPLFGNLPKKKRVSWNEVLFEIQEYDIDEDEEEPAVHYSCEEARQMEAEMERKYMKQRSEDILNAAKQNLEPTIEWYTPPALDLPPVTRGQDSMEKTTQLRRESSCLMVVYVRDEQIPPSPAEPTVPIKDYFDQDVRMIPTEDPQEALQRSRGMRSLAEPPAVQQQPPPYYGAPTPPPHQQGPYMGDGYMPHMPQGPHPHPQNMPHPSAALPPPPQHYPTDMPVDYYRNPAPVAPPHPNMNMGMNMPPQPMPPHPQQPYYPPQGGPPPMYPPPTSPPYNHMGGMPPGMPPSYPPPHQQPPLGSGGYPPHQPQQPGMSSNPAPPFASQPFKRLKEPCRFFSRTGGCRSGNNCPYSHNDASGCDVRQTMLRNMGQPQQQTTSPSKKKKWNS